MSILTNLQKISFSAKVIFILIKILAFKSNQIGVRICLAVKANFRIQIGALKSVRLINPQVLSAIHTQGLSITMHYGQVLLQETVMMTSF